VLVGLSARGRRVAAECDANSTRYLHESSHAEQLSRRRKSVVRVRAIDLAIRIARIVTQTEVTPTTYHGNSNVVGTASITCAEVEASQRGRDGAAAQLPRRIPVRDRSRQYAAYATWHREAGAQRGVHVVCDPDWRSCAAGAEYTPGVRAAPFIADR
jgi:hypothetical protein